jgi:hypothetical protein
VKNKERMASLSFGNKMKYVPIVCEGAQRANATPPASRDRTQRCTLPGASRRSAGQSACAWRTVSFAIAMSRAGRSRPQQAGVAQQRVEGRPVEGGQLGIDGAVHAVVGGRHALEEGGHAHRVVERRQGGRHAVGIAQRPVLQVRVAVAEQDEGGDAAHALPHVGHRLGRQAVEHAQHLRPVDLKAAAVLLARLVLEHLRELLHVHTTTPGRAVEAADREDLVEGDLLGQLRIGARDDARLGAVEAQRAAEAVARELVGHQVGMAHRRQLEDEGTGRAVAPHHVAPPLLHGGELDDHTGDRGRVLDRRLDEAGLQHVEPERGVPVAYGVGDALGRRHRLDLDRAHQIVAGGGQQLEFVVGAAAALLREALAVVAFGQQVLEVGGPVAVAARQADVARRREDGPGRRLVRAAVGQRQRRPRRIGHVVGIEGDPQDVAVLGQVADRPPPAAGQVQRHPQVANVGGKS